MEILQALSSSSWYSFLEEEGKKLVQLSLQLYSREVRLHSSLDDYSFIVFPMAKAYEGFLKKFLWNSGLLDQEQYVHKQFRIGRSLNPDVPYSQRDRFWLYDDVEQACSPEVAKMLWTTWLDCRNHLFHYFPDSRADVSLEDSRRMLDQMNTAMNRATACTIHHTISPA